MREGLKTRVTVETVCRKLRGMMVWRALHAEPNPWHITDGLSWTDGQMSNVNVVCHFK